MSTVFGGGSGRRRNSNDSLNSVGSSISLDEQATEFLLRRPERRTEDASDPSSSNEAPLLGLPRREKRFWFQRGEAYDPDAIATQVGPNLLAQCVVRQGILTCLKPSVFDDPDTAREYLPRPDW